MQCVLKYHDDHHTKNIERKIGVEFCGKRRKQWRKAQLVVRSALDRWEQKKLSRSRELLQGKD